MILVSSYSTLREGSYILAMNVPQSHRLSLSHDDVVDDVDDDVDVDTVRTTSLCPPWWSCQEGREVGK